MTYQFSHHPSVQICEGIKGITNVDFEGTEGNLGGTHLTYNGLGIVGTGTYWNSVGINGIAAGTLKYDDGTTFAAGIDISNTQANTYSESTGSALLMDRIIFGTKPSTVTISHLAVGSLWDLVVYASFWDEVFSANGVGAKAANGDGFQETNPNLWTEGNQYVLFENVIVDALGQIIVSIDENNSYSTIGGLQLASVSLVNSVTSVPVPEPSSIALLALGLAGLQFSRRRSEI